MRNVGFEPTTTRFSVEIFCCKYPKINRLVFFAVGFEPTNDCLEGNLSTIDSADCFAEPNLKLGGDNPNRTGDTQIFSLLLYQLSYIAIYGTS